MGGDGSERVFSRAAGPGVTAGAISGERHLAACDESHLVQGHADAVAERCDACGERMQRMGHCKWLCRCCGFLRTCIDTV